VFSFNNVSLDNLQLLEVEFPTSYSDVITSTQEENIKITEAQNQQDTKIKEYDGRVTKATQDKITITNNALAFSTTSKTKYNTAENEYTFYLPNMKTTWNDMKASHGASTPAVLMIEF